MALLQINGVNIFTEESRINEIPPIFIISPPNFRSVSRTEICDITRIKKYKISGIESDNINKEDKSKRNE